MTHQQLAFDICDPTWTTPPTPSRQELSPSEERDLRANGLTSRQLYTMTTVKPAGSYL